MVTEEIRKKIVVETEMRDKIKSRLDALNAQFQKLSNTLKKNKQQLSALNLKIQGGGRGPKDIEKWKNSMLKLKRINHGLNQSMDLVRHKIDLQADGMRNSTREIRQLEMSGKKLAKQQANMDRLMSGGAQKLIRNANVVNRLGKQYDSFSGVMKMSQENFVKFNKEGGLFESKGGRIANKVRMMTHGLRGFRMEFLGIMFFGMALKRLFTGLLRPAAEMLGVFDIWTVILQTMFLPIMLELLPYLLDFMNWVLNLSPEVKKAIGVVALLGLAFGTFLQLFGAVMLGLGSILFFGAADLVAYGLMFAAVFAGLILIFAGFLKIQKGQWDGLGLIIMGIGAIMLTFTGLWGAIFIVLGYIVYKFAKDWDSMSFNFMQSIRNWEVVLWGLAEVATKVAQAIIDPFGVMDKIFDPIKNKFRGLAEDASIEWQIAENENQLKQYASMGFTNFSDQEKTKLDAMLAETEKSIEGTGKSIKDTWEASYSKIASDTETKLAETNTVLDRGMLTAGTTTESFLTKNGITWDNGMEGLVTKTKLSVDEINSEFDQLDRRLRKYRRFGMMPSVDDQIKSLYNDPTSMIGDLMSRQNTSSTSSSMGANVNITQNNSFTGVRMEDVERAIKDNNTRLMDDIKKAVGI